MTKKGTLYSIYSNDIPQWLKPFLETEAVLRLKDVGMNCGMEYTRFPVHRDLKGCYSRYEHSVGTALILWHFTHDKKQTTAGLLHDISTPAFAHVIDFVNHDHLTQESTESSTRQVIEQSESLCALLKENGLMVDEVCDYHLYPLADNSSPKLSADRLEYTLGNAVNYQDCPLKTIQRLYGNLTAGINELGEEELMFTDQTSAAEFTALALSNSWIYAADEDRYGMQRLADLICEAMQYHILKKEDLMRTETEVISKLKSDQRTEQLWQDYCALEQIETSTEKPQEQGWMQIPAKKRWIDPYIENRGRICDLDPAIREKTLTFKAQDQSVWITEKKLKNFSNKC